MLRRTARIAQTPQPARSHFLQVRRRLERHKLYSHPPIRPPASSTARCFSLPVRLPFGSNTITAKYSGDANYAAITSAPSSISVKITTTSAISTSAPTIQQGQSVTFTATVTQNQAGGPGPTGTVQFTANGTNIGSAVTLSGGKAQVTSSSLPPGTDCNCSFVFRRQQL